ncbi:MAG: DUF2207 domain-containing protein [Woeseiaceae bacterium]|nr:DUF2207 domain-containing protein [Woeseiaceae bacterium]
MRILWLGCLALIPALATADERILEFASDITVRRDGSLLVTETIRVRAEGAQIRRGIYRDFPIDYVDRFGNQYRVRFEPLGVTRNDNPEAFHSERLGRNVRVYFGSADRLIASGVHSYAFRYEVSRVLGYFDDHDELYWNVTGNDWSFPIDRAAASVSFDFEVAADELELFAYTGPRGSAGRDYRAFIDGTGSASFETTRNFERSEGLTIAVTWPKGLVVEPGLLQKSAWLLADNLNLLIAVAGLLALFSYYVPTWRHFGKDPEPGVMFTRYEPPKGFSPASLRYIEQMGYDDTSMTAAVVSLAVKGYLRIIEDDDEHSLLKIAPGHDAAPLAAGEAELYEALFRESDVVVLDDEYHERIGGARRAHEESLRRDYKNRYFKTNVLLNVPAIGVAIVASLFALRVEPGPTFAVFLSIGAMLLVVVVFAMLLRRPTGLGRRLLDEVGGFREYLDIAEKDELNLRNPPDKTPALFEAYLPYALAMGVEQRWGEKFSSVLANVKRPDGSDYQPTWYRGSWDSFDMRSNTESLSDGLGTAISSSVSPPGSSSGAGGGGSSGGGGGGGGGGGW